MLGGLPGQLRTIATVMAVVAVLAAATLAVADTKRLRTAALGVGLAALLLAPASWSVQTLGHATNGTFPAGGPATSGFAGGGPAAGGAPPGGLAFAGPRAGGGMFGGNASLTSAIAYAEQHGGGTIAVSSQSSAAGTVLTVSAGSSNVDIAALGGFSGRESEVSVQWLADRVADGSIRWVLTDGEGAGGLGNDGRTGSSEVMAAVAATCTPVASVDGLYDCSGAAAALAAAAT